LLSCFLTLHLAPWFELLLASFLATSSITPSRRLSGRRPRRLGEMEDSVELACTRAHKHVRHFCSHANSRACYHAPPPPRSLAHSHSPSIAPLLTSPRCISASRLRHLLAPSLRRWLDHSCKRRDLPTARLLEHSPFPYAKLPRSLAPAHAHIRPPARLLALILPLRSSLAPSPPLTHTPSHPPARTHSSSE
jgi:hypothetical protein